MARSLRSWLRTLVGRSRLERELQDELQFHHQARVDDLMRAGLAREEAVRRARLEFGGVEGYKARCREARGAATMDEVSRCLREAWRSTRRSPGFVAIAVVSLALGIGANIAIFSLLHALMLSPLPVRDPGSLRQVVLSTVRQPYYRMPHTKFKTLGEEIPVFESLFGWGWNDEIDLVAGDTRDRVRMTLVTGGYFEGLGVRPAHGRLISTDDDRPGGGANVAVIGHRLWRRMFNADPEVVGRTVSLPGLTDVKGGEVGLTVQVIGIAPPGFDGAVPASPADVFIPVHAMQPLRPQLIAGGGNMWMHVMGRLKPEVSDEQAAVALREGWSRIDQEGQARRGDNTRPEFMILEDGSHGYSDVRLEFARPVAVLMGRVAIVFLITCANLASLLFVRATRRADEMSVRTALGASRAQLIRQWLTECLLLAVAGGVAGLLAARSITVLLLQFLPEESRAPLQFEATLEVIAFAVALTVGAALLFGWLPALRASRVDVQEALRAHARTLAAGRGRAARLVLAGQIAASMVLVVGAVLFARTLWNLNQTPTGFDRRTVVYAGPSFFAVGYPRDRALAVWHEFLQTARRSPHFTSVAVGPTMLLDGPGSWTWARVPGYTFAPGENNIVFNYWASPRYFRTLSIPFVAGRDFEDSDSDIGVEPVRIIVSERLARHYYTGRNPIGQLISFGAGKPREIIGVVRDVRDASLRSDPADLVYLPMANNVFGTLLAQVAPGVTTAVAEAHLRSTFHALASDVPLEIGPMEDAVRESLSRDRLVAQLSAAFGALGVLLASIGLFGAVAHWASGRTREIGIRMALGATRWDVGRMVLKQSVSVTVVGVVVGVPLSLAAAVLLQPLLFGVSSRDAPTLVVSAALLGSAGLLAASWPALRAARLNPLDALRDR
jgi:predicted permease